MEIQGIKLTKYLFRTKSKMNKTSTFCSIYFLNFIATLILYFCAKKEMVEINGLSEKDKQFIWHPYTHINSTPAAIPIVKGEKAILYDEQGNRYIDGISSWWVNIHGHGNKYIAKKI
jgi:hypothetical protein